MSILAENLRGAILLATYSRPQELRNCLNSAIEQVGIARPQIIVVHQRGNKEVAQVISDFRPRIDYLIEVDTLGRSPLENINYNRILGYEICFDYLNFDWVLAIEEDIVISNDSFDFCNQTVEKYWRNPLFRGVNLGSYEIVSEKDKHTYSLLSYGLHGQAGAITKKTWRKLNKRSLFENSNRDGFDGQIEKFLKLGFFVTSNASRYLDFGWNGTHAASNEHDHYYSQLRQSWIGNLVSPYEEFKRKQIKHRWRKDSINFGIRSLIESRLKFVRQEFKDLFRIIMKA